MRWFLILLTLGNFGKSIALTQKIDLRGIVSGSASGEKILYATIRLEGANKSAVTNNNGFFSLPESHQVNTPSQPVRSDIKRPTRNCASSDQHQ